MANKNETKNKRSKGWKTTFILITSVTLIVVSLIVVPTSIYIVRNYYPIAKILPVSKETKINAFWRSLDGDKLKKLKKAGKINFYDFNDDNTVYISDDKYAFIFIFNNNDSSKLPIIKGHPVQNNGSSTTETEIIFTPLSTDLDGLEDDSGILSKSEVEELAKKGIELYNQFVEDYDNV